MGSIAGDCLPGTNEKYQETGLTSQSDVVHLSSPEPQPKHKTQYSYKLFGFRKKNVE